MTATTIEIVTAGNRTVARCAYAEKDIVKAAGFRWDPARKEWWTTDAEATRRLRELLASGRSADERAATQAAMQSLRGACDRAIGRLHDRVFATTTGGMMTPEELVERGAGLVRGAQKLVNLKDRLEMMLHDADAVDAFAQGGYQAAWRAYTRPGARYNPIPAPSDRVTYRRPRPVYRSRHWR